MPDMERVTRRLHMDMAREGRTHDTEGEARNYYRGLDRGRVEAACIAVVVAVAAVLVSLIKSGVL